MSKTKTWLLVALATLGGIILGIVIELRAIPEPKA